jgi:hypothetical protein
MNEDPSSSAGMSRRNVLRGLAGVPIGLAVGAASLPASEAIKSEVEDDTGHQAGSAQPLASDTFVTTVAPIAEELSFRAAPSVLVDVLEGSTVSDALDKTVHGAGGISVGRRELIGGLVTSVLFASAHNITDKGIDVKTIPASQFVDGVAYWSLQRRWGFLTNLAAHSMHNVLSVIKK